MAGNTYASYFHLLAQFACRLLFALCYFNQVPGDATRDSIEGLLPLRLLGFFFVS